MKLNSGEDVFAKIKGMIGDMIEKLEQEAAEAAELKEWCDKEIAESTAKRDDEKALFDKLSSKLDTATAESEKLKEEVATLQKELADLAKAQAEATKIRGEEKTNFDANHPEMEQGLKGIKIALKILNEYYAKAGKSHGSSDGAGGGIVGMLEVIESDFTKSITEMVAAEQMAADTYEKETKENAVDKTIGELTTERSGVEDELNAVNDYLASLDKKCTYKVESYAERKARRQAEIDGLKEALEVLESE